MLKSNKKIFKSFKKNQFKFYSSTKIGEWENMIKSNPKASIPSSSFRHNLEVKPLYTIDDLPQNLSDELPGKYPFTRGPYPTMYTQSPWTIRQYAGIHFFFTSQIKKKTQPK